MSSSRSLKGEYLAVVALLGEVFICLLLLKLVAALDDDLVYCVGLYSLLALAEGVLELLVVRD